ncbi:hypothetical protein Tco_0357486, partial [Tanacetum coccineum]
EDDAELIFPYEVEGDKTPPPRDVSSDSELEDEEIDVAPEVNVALEVDVAPKVNVAPKVDVAPEVDDASEATVGTSSQKPYVIHDFLRSLYEVGESSSARDSSYVGGLAPWALRRDLETSQGVGIGKQRECHIEEKVAETETKLEWARMECDMDKRRLHVSQGWNKRFYMEMVRIRVVPKPPSDDEDTERPRKKSKNSPPSGTESLLSHMDHLKELKEKLLGDVPIIRDSPEVFPKELPGLSPRRKVEFRIDLIPGAAPVARAPYRLAPSEMEK